MISTADLSELLRVVNSEHADPHHILGMHEITLKGKACLSVRVFNPQAKEVFLLDPNSKKTKLPFKKIHEDGFFELIIKDQSKWFRYLLSFTTYNDETWETYDPYSFAPVISDMDMYLFGEGTHYEIYEKLGAHQIEVDGIKGTLFAVWAPNARRISVVGSFNNWDGRRHSMRSLKNSGIWELFIPNLNTYDEYKFELKSQDGTIFEKSDPFGNFFALRPSKANLIFDINNFNWTDDKWLLNREENSPLNSAMNIYEVHLGSWMRKVEDNNRFMSYTELADTLIPYVKDMGYNYIELMPILEHPFDGSWGYQVTGFYAPTSRFGTPHEFMYFVDKCHENGIGVLLDWVPGHFPKDANGLAKFDGTCLYEHQDPRIGEHFTWGTLVFNYGRSEVKNFLIANALYWINKYHLDGLRVDAVASMLYLDYDKKPGEWIPNQHGGNENYQAVEFFKHLNSIINQKHKNVLMIAEESTSWSGVTRSPNYGGLGFNLKWNMGWMNDFLKYIEKDSIYRKYHHNNLTFGMVYAYSEKFCLVLSHDEVVHGKGSLINKMPGDMWQKFANLRVSYGFMYTHPGKKLLFMGGEFAQFAEWNFDKSLDWHLLDFDSHKNLKNYVKDLNNLYINEKALWTYDFCGNGFEWIDADDADRSEVSYIRKTDDPKDSLIIVCNFTPVPLYNHLLGVPYSCDYREVFNSDNQNYGGSGILNDEIIKPNNIPHNLKENSIYVKVPPLGVTVLKPIL